MKIDFIDDNAKQLVLFDMDGVLAEYVAGEERAIIDEVKGVYLNKRPMKSIINIAEDLNKRNNITIGILSSCEYPSQVIEKKEWLKKYASFIAEENIHIIVWCDDDYARETRRFAKLDKLKNIMCDYDKVFLIEDTHENIKAINNEIPNVAHHISELIE